MSPKPNTDTVRGHAVVPENVLRRRKNTEQMKVSAAPRGFCPGTDQPHPASPAMQLAHCVCGSGQTAATHSRAWKLSCATHV